MSLSSETSAPMNQTTGVKPASPSWIVSPVLFLLFLNLPMAAAADQPKQTIPEPGFRPPSEHFAPFVRGLPNKTAAVLPTIVRRADRTSISTPSQRQLVEQLNEAKVIRATASSRRLEPGPLPQAPQWGMFQYTLGEVAEFAKAGEIDADYAMVMEVLIPPQDRAVFGVHLFIVDREGRNAFSFLLNSHHKMFVEADLVAKGSSSAARRRMIAKATTLAVNALQAQIQGAQECAARMAAGSIKIGPGVLHDFESGLPSGVDPHGVAVGYSTFGDDKSTVKISTTSKHPPRPGQSAGNHVMQLDLNVTGWGGVVKLFEDDSAKHWISLDWREADAFSFWLYGNNSGTSLYLHILDNRHLCSTVDDAERHAFEFVDDFSGWRHFTVPFADLVRRDVGNGAPNDGLGLSSVHGWGFGALNTGGERTYYIDDFELRRTAQ